MAPIMPSGEFKLPAVMGVKDGVVEVEDDVSDDVDDEVVACA